MWFIYIIFSIILVQLILLLHDYFTRTRNYWRKRGVPGPTPLPIVGNFLDLLFDPLNVVEERRLLNYGTVYGTFEFSRPVLTIADPDLIREVTIKQFHNFPNRYNRNPGDEFQKKSIFTMKGDNWKNVRSIISPVFTASKMKRLYKHVDKCAENTLQYIENLAIKDDEVVLKDVMMSFTFDTIAKCIFGVETNSYKDPNNVFIAKAKEFIDFKLWRIMATLLLPVKIQKPLNIQIIDENLVQYLVNVLRNIIKERKNSDLKVDDFVTILLDREDGEQNIDSNDNSDAHYNIQSKEDLELQKNAMSLNISKRMLNEDEIIANSLLFFTAGYETTSTLLNFTLYCLAIRSDVQELLFSEINDFLTQNKAIDYNELNDLKYLDAVICESLRLYTPVVNLDRFTANDTILGETGIRVEKGTLINLPFYAMHHNPTFFPEPYEFKPDRFFPENKHLIKPYTYLPFGVGPRNCIGMRFALMSAKLFLVKLLHRFEVLRSSSTPLKPKFTSNFVLLGSEPIYVKFAVRDQSKAVNTLTC